MSSNGPKWIKSVFGGAKVGENRSSLVPTLDLIRDIGQKTCFSTVLATLLRGTRSSLKRALRRP